MDFEILSKKVISSVCAEKIQMHSQWFWNGLLMKSIIELIAYLEW